MTTRLIIVTGLSGAGKSSALKILEDLSYEAVDNVPQRLLDAIVPEPGGTEPVPHAIAIGIDGRTRGFNAQSFTQTLENFRARGDLTVTVVFMDCDDEILVRRYTETRRRHPLAQDRTVADGIAAERQAMADVRAAADIVIDTSALSVHDLKRDFNDRFSLDSKAGLVVTVQSFAYRHGLPREADLVFDVRFLSNPYWDMNLRAGTGLDATVGQHIAADPAYRPFMNDLNSMLGRLLKAYTVEGKCYLTIAVGCTGGRHRSVFVARELAAAIAAQGYVTRLVHRELGGSEALARQA